MKKLFTTSLFMFVLVSAGMAATVSIGVSGTTFTNATATAQVGDVIEFTLSGIHTATQVSQATWNANGNTSNGGFNFSGTATHQYTVVAGDIGTIYYVCSPHASMQMKGQITVTAATPVLKTLTAMELIAYPNPTSGSITLDNSEAANVKVYDQSGTIVKELYIEKDGQLDLSGLVNGVYFITAISNTGKESRARIVKK